MNSTHSHFDLAENVPCVRMPGCGVQHPCHDRRWMTAAWAHVEGGRRSVAPVARCGTPRGIVACGEGDGPLGEATTFVRDGA